MASGRCRLGYYVLSSTDLNNYALIGTDNLPSLSVGERETENITIDLCDENLENGTYYVGYYIDDLGEITESDETDNGFWYRDDVSIAYNFINCALPIEMLTPLKAHIFEYPSSSINVSNVSQGIYMIEAIVGNGVFYHKIIIEK